MTDCLSLCIFGIPSSLVASHARGFLTLYNPWISISPTHLVPYPPFLASHLHLPCIACMYIHPVTRTQPPITHYPSAVTRVLVPLEALYYLARIYPGCTLSQRWTIFTPLPSLPSRVYMSYLSVISVSAHIPSLSLHLHLSPGIDLVPPLRTLNLSCR